MWQTGFLHLCLNRSVEQEVIEEWRLIRYYVDNNVSSLINKFEVRNYPKNSRMAAPEPDEELYVRRRIPSAANGRERHVYLNDSAVFYDSVESVPPNVRFRTRYNDSLSSLNESDYGGGVYDSTVEEYQDEPLPISKEQVASSLSRFGAILQMLSKIPFPRMSVTGMGLCSLVAIFICPRTLGSNILFPGFRLLFGTLYPAYASYKAVRTKNVKEYVKWMMYWIVFAFFTCIETFTDILLSWFPFYYEIKVIIVLWLLSPATRGSSTLYRKFVHPMLTRREQEIDDYINQAKEKGYTAVLQLGSKGVNYATNVIMQTAIKGGGGLVQTLRKSYSLSDLSEPDTHRTQEEIDELTRPQRVLRSKSARSSSGGRHVEMYFPEVEIAGTPHHNPPPPYNYIRSSDDISSGYSSAEPGLSRTASMSNTVRPRVKSKTREDKMSASCTTLPRSKKPEKVIKTRSKTEK
ncbi:receptor expression-enhancing protein 4 isoform X5 [Aedes albopictus]|uniref:Receptor expression-enhancing protein n=1 Tax=Aedes albopictus TaxID=7160 RepID=A0ABM1YL26_AEDAL